MCFVFMRRLFLRPFLLFILAILSGCTQSTPTNPTASDEIIPLAVGNTWLYEYTDFDENGNISHKDTSDLTLHLSYEQNGEKLFLVALGAPGFLTAFLKRNDGIWVYREVDLAPSSYNYEVLYPFRVDSSISLIFEENRFTDSLGNRMFDTILHTYKLEDDNVTKVVPAGQFQCLKYIIEDSNLTRKRMEMRVVEFYSLNVGLIYREEYEGHVYRPLNLISQKALVSYKLY